MDSFDIFHALVLPLFATWFIPNSIRDQRTGKYLGMNNSNARLCLILVIILETRAVLGNNEMGVVTLLRIIGSTLLTFIGGYIMVKLTHKKLYGQKIMFTKWW